MYIQTFMTKIKASSNQFCDFRYFQREHILKNLMQTIEKICKYINKNKNVDGIAFQSLCILSLKNVTEFTKLKTVWPKK